MASVTRTPSAGAFTSSVVSSAALNNLPGGLIGYATPITSNQSSIGNSTPVTGMSITLTPAANRILKIEVSLAMAAATTSGEFQVVILKDGTQIQRHNFPYAPTTSSDALGVSVRITDNGPTNASHTYTVNVGRSSADSNSWTMTATSTAPATFEIYDSGPHF